MMDVDMPIQSSNNDCLVSRNRIKAYKSILNYYKGKSLSLDVVLASKQPNIKILPDMKNYEILKKDIECLHDDITLMQSMKNCLNVVNCSLTSVELMGINDLNIKRKSLEKIQGIIFFSNSVLKLHRENFTEIELLNRMNDYSAFLEEYMKNLEQLKQNEENGDSEEHQQLEKARLQIYKINLMRAMKSTLIGCTVLNCPQLLKDFLKYKSHFRRDLTMDDFRDTWDVGLKSN